MAKKRKSVGKTIEWMVGVFVIIFKMLRDKTRSLEDISLLETEMQAVIDGDRKGIDTRGLRGLVESYDPEKIWQGWSKLYRLWDAKYRVLKIPYNLPRIEKEADVGRILIYVHPRLCGIPGLKKFQQLFPEMSYHLEQFVMNNSRYKFINTNTMTGWMFVEKSLEIPDAYKVKGVDVLRRRFWLVPNTGGMTLNMYIIFARFCKDIYRKYPDSEREKEEEILLISSSDSNRPESVVCASFMKQKDNEQLSMELVCSSYELLSGHERLKGGRSARQ